MEELTWLLKESFAHNMANVHTAFPAVIVKYDAEKRRADVQPSIKHRLPSGDFVDLPVISDVPVIFQGTKRFTLCFPLEKDDEVLCICAERSLDAWRDTGGSGIEESDPRRFNLMDCVAIAGLQAVDFGSETASIEVDDEKLLIKHDKAEFEIKGNKVSFKNDGKDFFEVLSKVLDDMKQAVENVKTFAGNVKNHKTAGSPASHTVSPDDISKFALDEQNFSTDSQNFGSDKSDLAEIMEAGE